MANRRLNALRLLYYQMFFGGTGGIVVPPPTGDTRITQDLDRRIVHGGDVRIVN